MKLFVKNYEYLRVIDLEMMKVNEKNYFQVIPPDFFAFCNEIIHVTLCGTKGCLYQILSKTICQHIIDNLNYYKYCVEVSKIWDTNNGTDANGFERIFNPENNEDGVSAFDKDGDEYNVASASKTVLSSVYNTLFDKLSVKYVIENIDKIPVTIAFPDSQMLDIIVLFDPNNYSTSNRSNKSDNESHVASLD